MKLMLCLASLCSINFGTIQGEGNVSRVFNASDLSYKYSDEEVTAGNHEFATASYNSTTASSNITREVADSTTPGSERCKCVYYYYCSEIGILYDPLVSCQYLEVCCAKSQLSDVPLTQYFTNRPTSQCGVRHPQGVGFLTPTAEGEAKFGEFPWMVAVFTESSTQMSHVSPAFQCGGSLIHPQVVLTAAHCVTKKDVKYTIRAGEWDLQNENENYFHQDRHVKSVVVHPRYKPDVLFNNVALLILEAPVKITNNVEVACLPKQNMPLDGLKCFVTGWGKDVSGNKTTILKKIEVPILPHNTCQRRLRETRLGKYFILDPSFICAGGERGVDTCKGDGGGPLVCPIPGLTGRYFQAGIVSWGIGCGEGVPGAYANVPMFVDWIDEQIVRNYFTISSYKY